MNNQGPQFPSESNISVGAPTAPLNKENILHETSYMIFTNIFNYLEKKGKKVKQKNAGISQKHTTDQYHQLEQDLEDTSNFIFHENINNDHHQESDANLKKIKNLQTFQKNYFDFYKELNSANDQIPEASQVKRIYGSYKQYYSPKKNTFSKEKKYSHSLEKYNNNNTADQTEQLKTYLNSFSEIYNQIKNKKYFNNAYNDAKESYSKNNPKHEIKSTINSNHNIFKERMGRDVHRYTVRIQEYKKQKNKIEYIKTTDKLKESTDKYNKQNPLIRNFNPFNITLFNEMDSLRNSCLKLKNEIENEDE